MKKACIILFLLIGIVRVNANNYDFEVDGMYYNILSIPDQTVEVTYFCRGDWPNERQPSNYSGDIVVPPTVTFKGKEYKVVSIGKYAFSYSPITSIKFPPSVRTINYSAFSGVVMKKFVIPSTIVRIDSAPNVLDELIIEDSDIPFSAPLDNEETWGQDKKWKYVYVGRVLTSTRIADGITTVKLGEKLTDNCIEWIIRSATLNNFEGTEFDAVRATFILTQKEPPVLKKEFGKHSYMNIVIRVPKASLSKYQAAPIWCNFFNIEGY